MLIITITFAVLVALWGFSGVAVSFAKRSLSNATARPRPAARPVAGSRTRGTRPVASA